MPFGWEVTQIETTYFFEVEVVKVWYFRVPDELGKTRGVAETGRGDDVVLEVLGMEGWAVESQVSHYASGDVAPDAADVDGGQPALRNGIPGTLRPSLPCQGLQAQHRLRVLSLRRTALTLMW